MKTIEHNSQESRRKLPMVWPQAWIVMALGWAGYLYFYPVNWVEISLGFLTGGLLVAWAVDITGNKVPDFMVPKDARRQSPRDWSEPR